MKTAQAAETLLTGIWLGLSQVCLGFSIMASAGASALWFFLTLLIWLCGSAAGVVLLKPGTGRYLIFVALLSAIAARQALMSLPFDNGALIIGLSAAFILGAYAGLFFRERSMEWNQVRLLLFYENNGFLLGFVAGSALIFVSGVALTSAVFLSGSVLVIWRLLPRGS